MDASAPSRKRNVQKKRIKLASEEVLRSAQQAIYDGAMAGPVAYFITWTTKTSWLHGESEGAPSLALRAGIVVATRLSEAA